MIALDEHIRSKLERCGPGGFHGGPPCPVRDSLSDSCHLYSSPVSRTGGLMDTAAAHPPLNGGRSRTSRGLLNADHKLMSSTIPTDSGCDATNRLWSHLNFRFAQLYDDQVAVKSLTATPIMVLCTRPARCLQLSSLWTRPGLFRNAVVRPRLTLLPPTEVAMTSVISCLCSLAIQISADCPNRVGRPSRDDLREIRPLLLAEHWPASIPEGPGY